MNPDCTKCAQLKDALVSILCLASEGPDALGSALRVCQACEETAREVLAAIEAAERKG